VTAASSIGRIGAAALRTPHFLLLYAAMLVAS
jgi:hypothetical protein